MVYHIISYHIISYIISYHISNQQPGGVYSVLARTATVRAEMVGVAFVYLTYICMGYTMAAKKLS